MCAPRAVSQTTGAHCTHSVNRQTQLFDGYCIAPPLQPTVSDLVVLQALVMLAWAAACVAALAGAHASGVCELQEPLWLAAGVRQQPEQHLALEAARSELIRPLGLCAEHRDLVVPIRVPA